MPHHLHIILKDMIFAHIASPPTGGNNKEHTVIFVARLSTETRVLPGIGHDHARGEWDGKSYGVKGVFKIVPKAALAAEPKALPILILGQGISAFTDLRTDRRNATCVISSVAILLARV